MQEIMNKVKVMSSQKSDDSASKLKSKLKMLVSARESELQAWQNLEEKYPSSSLTSFLQEFKSESFDAEHRLVEKIERMNNYWGQTRNAKDIVDGKVFIKS